MNDKRFDDIIKNKLGGHSSGEESDWMDFAHILASSKDLSEDADFDRQIKTKLDQANDEYQPSHWEILKEKLEIEDYIRTRLYLIKGVELSILVLIYMVFTMYFNPFESIQQRLADPVATSSPMALVNDASTISPKRDFLESFPTATNQAAFKQKDNYVEEAAMLAFQKEPPVRSVQLELPSIERKQIQGVLLDNLLPLINPTPPQRIERKKSSNFNKLPFVNAQLEYLKEIHDFKEGILFVEKSTMEDQDGVYAFLSTEFNADIIDSPRDNVYPNYLSYLSYSKGYSLSLGVLKRTGSFDLGIGLRYIQQLYSPRKISETIGGVTEGTRTTTLKKIEYDVLSIPLNLDYRILNKPSWNLFASAGLSMNVIGFAAYVAQEELNQRSARRFNIKGNKQVDQELDYLSQKDFDLGFFQGAPIFDNLFMTASVGAGFEKRIGARTSLNISTHYRHHLFSAEVGPNDDKIHSLVFSLGARYKM